MSKPRTIVLSETQRKELEQIRDQHPCPYYRERASAILKLADGMPLSQIARGGLLRRRTAETVRDWITRYEQAGVAGLAIREGRGRKPAFFSP